MVELVERRVVAKEVVKRMVVVMVNLEIKEEVVITKVEMMRVAAVVHLIVLPGLQYALNGVIVKQMNNPMVIQMLESVAVTLIVLRELQCVVNMDIVRKVDI